ncbi:PLP-dependent aminotransferase family protein [Crenobacter cavernae]|uniref:Putative 8-amino-7-oxononanoate synthase n=1 Tax=Crenobacter cavernae TaxID=2290923 RepID=A0A345Y205_9NEIS|nr:PLP-dependent aminotransferase family protein [Crenobacter cavernae]AXK37957.1 PLP-dependent aminotransferase family protein [Crenobacter cavernae]
MSTKLIGTMWGQLFQQHTQSGMSLQGKIRQMLVSAILDGQLPVGVPLPSSRELSGQLGVARNTVVLAYQQLVDEGYLVSRERSGYFVNADILAGRMAPKVVPQDKPHTNEPDWERRFVFRPTRQRNIVKRANWQDYPYPFIYGQYDPILFPTADWRECSLKALSVLDIHEWAQDMILRDDESLVQQIRTRVLPRRGVWASADEIVVTVGAQQALYLLADLLVSPDTPVGIEDPGYPDARHIFGSRTSHLLPLPVDEEGLKVTGALHNCDYVYVTPSHQCPTTVTMPLARREALLQMAEDADFILIEDDYESENRFEGDPTPTLKSLDRNNRVIYVGSLSKSLAPGLRIGYIVGPAELIAELRGVRRLMLRHPSAYIQRAFALFLSLGHYDSHLRRLSAAHRERAQALSDALARHLPEVRPVPITGGASCWIVGPEWLDAEELSQRAEENGVLIEPGSVFFMSTAMPRNGFRLGYSSIPLEKIEPGIQKLAEVMRTLKPSASS